MEAVKSSKRTLEILELLTSSEAGLTFTQISEVLALPRSSLHGLLTTLVDASWLAYDDPGKTYRLGIRTLESGNAYLRSQDLPNRARAPMERIRDTIDETVQLSVLDGRFNVYVSKVDGNQALSLASAVGRRLPAHATGVGKVLLAGLPESSLDALFRSVRMERFTAQTVADLPSLRKRLARIRRLGYGTDEEEYTIGVRCVAVPIRDQHGVIVAAMSVSAPAVRFDKKRSQEALDLLVDAAAQLSSALGYEGRPA
jgi:DNA-binding IclR family transcriptional regulator